MSGTNLMLVAAITFNPGWDQLRRLLSWLHDSGCEAVIYDNSTDAEKRAAVATGCANSRIRYVSSGTNVGTAGGLNTLLDLASAGDYPWLLYLDQDSSPEAGFVDAAVATASDAPEDVCLIGSRVVHRTHGVQSDEQSKRSMVETRYVISSGCAMRVDSLRRLGGYDEDLFLDLVDHEMCLRLRSAGYRIMEDSGRAIHHDIGRGSRPAAYNRLHVTRHPWWRRRLMWRNTIILVGRYGRRFPSDVTRLMLGRIAETLLGAWHFKEPRFLSTAVQGAWWGLRSPRQRLPNHHPAPPGSRSTPS